MTGDAGEVAQQSVPMCCACTSDAVARVLDGAFRKPVCADHRRLYGAEGYLLDALWPVDRRSGVSE